MQRRTWILGTVSGLGVGLAQRTFAQPPGKIWRIGFLSLGSPASESRGPISHLGVAFRQGMHELGYIEGRNLVIEWSHAGGQLDRLPLVAAGLVQLKVDVIVVAGSQATGAAQKATRSIPIVMTSSLDPVGDGYVQSLARPGGNITGFSNLAGDLGPKYLELILGMLPKLASIAVMTNPTNSGHPAIFNGIESVAASARIKVLRTEVQAAEGLDAAFVTMKREKAGAVFVVLDPIPNYPETRKAVAQLSVKHQIPVFSNFRELTEAGGLMSYGQNLAVQYKSAATYVDKILKGRMPADLPVEQSTRLELLINLKAARALDVTVPKIMMLRADEVIE